MTDRPIIFSAPMVRALLSGRKTQTRRLASSPLRRCEVGDRLYVRESYAVRGIFSDVVEVGYSASERQSHTEYVEQIPVDLATVVKVTWPKARPSIHMPRWVSRLTLTVTDVRVEPLMPISNGDARDEGLIAYRAEELSGHHVDAWHWLPGIADRAEMFGSASSAYAALWSSLHTKDGERWQDNPAVVALTFRVERGNIDRIGQ